MRWLYIRWGLAAAAAFVAWLIWGRYLTLVVDRVYTVRVASLPVSPMEFTAASFVFGGRSLGTLLPGHERLEIRIEPDSRNRYVLRCGGKSFVLGPVNQRGELLSWTEYAFSPEPGDEVSLTLERSPLSWPTPFDFNFMTGVSPGWKRHLYYKLRWRKASGARLRADWRYEQWCYSSGWSGLDGMLSDRTFGQIDLEIRER